MDNILEMKWKEYCEKYETDAMYFHDEKNGKLIMIAEGTGDSLLPEDFEDGIVDYWYAEVYTKENGNCGGGMLMQKTLIRDDNKSLGELMDYIEANASAFDGVEGTSLKDTLVDANEGEALLDIYEKYASEFADKHDRTLSKETYDRVKKYVEAFANPADEERTQGLLVALEKLYNDDIISWEHFQELWFVADPKDRYINLPAEKYESDCRKILAYADGKAVLLTDIDWQWDREDIHNLIYGENLGDEPKLSEEDFYKLMEKTGRTYESELLGFEMEDELEDALHHNALTPEDVFGLPATLVIEVEDPSTWADEDITNYLYNEYGFHIGADGWKRDTDPVISEDDIEL